MSKLAIHGGTPVRDIPISYGRQWLDDQDIAEVVNVLKSDWLTTGPTVDRFEKSFAEYVGTKEAVSVSNGTAALHAAMYALEIGSGDEVIVPSMTFASTANCVVFQGGTPVFADVEPDTLLVDPTSVKKKITSKTKAIIAMDYAGQPCHYNALQTIAERNGLPVVADACHALGGSYHGRKVGSLAALNTFSFHPVKPMTTGEGGMVTTNDAKLAKRMRTFRNHGIANDFRQRDGQNSWFYEMTDLGYNYRLSDTQCALGLSQLKKLEEFIRRRQQIASLYNQAFKENTGFFPLTIREGTSSAYHIYVILLNLEKLRVNRGEIFKALRAEGIGVNVHYVPVHLHPYYKKKFGTKPGDCPAAEHAYERALTLPLYPKMTDKDIADVSAAVNKVLNFFLK